MWVGWFWCSRRGRVRKTLNRFRWGISCCFSLTYPSLSQTHFSATLSWSRHPPLKNVSTKVRFYSTSTPHQLETMINGEFPPSACPVPVPITSNPVTDSSCGSSPCIRYSSPPVSLITCITWICLGNAQILCKNTSALFLGPRVCCLWILLVWVLLRLHLPLVIAISSCHCSRRKGETSQQCSL